MSQQTYVNRVDQSPFQKLEGELLKQDAEPFEIEEKISEAVAKFNPEDAPTQDQLPVYDILTGETIERSELALDEHYVTQVEPEQLPPFVEEPEDDQISVLAKAGDLIAELSKSKEFVSTLSIQGFQFDRFEIFRLQVIKAFKHLGLDVVKHFPE